MANRKNYYKFVLAAALALSMTVTSVGCGKSSSKKETEVTEASESTEAVTESETAAAETETAQTEEETETEIVEHETTATEYENPMDTTPSADTETETSSGESASDNSSSSGSNSSSGSTAYSDEVTSEQVYWSDSWKYADYSKVHQESVTLYHAPSSIAKGVTVAVNAGHGSKAAQQVKTQCHPDGTAKVTGGSTSAGSTTAIGANTGTTLLDGTAEATVTLALALKVKDALLSAGYDVLMLREDSDCDLDNIARTVYANNAADCHIALHYDSTDYDKGLYYTGVPDVSSYRSMEPVASHWQEHEAFGRSLIAGAREAGVKVWSSETMAVDLTQTSYSTVPSVDLEVGDRGSDHSDSTLSTIAQGIVDGVEIYFE